QQHAVPGLDFAREAAVAGRCTFARAHDLLGRDGERRTGLERASSVFETAQPDFGALKIEKNSDMTARGAGRAPDCLDATRMLILRTVRCIQAEYIYACSDHLLEDTGGVSRRSKGDYNFRVGHPIRLSCQTGRAFRRIKRVSCLSHGLSDLVETLVRCVGG